MDVVDSMERGWLPCSFHNDQVLARQFVLVHFVTFPPFAQFLGCQRQLAKKVEVAADL